jgi:hypothetical protein
VESAGAVCKAGFSCYHGWLESEISDVRGSRSWQGGGEVFVCGRGEVWRILRVVFGLEVSRILLLLED